MTRILISGVAGIVAGGALLAISNCSASAFTPFAPSLAPPIASSDVDRVWWDSWGRWHPDRPDWDRPHWGWGPPRYFHHDWEGGPHCWRGERHWHCD